MSTQSDMVVTDQASYAKVKEGKQTLKTWPEIAADIFPKLQAEFPQLREHTLEEFIKYCPYQMEFVADEPEHKPDPKESNKWIVGGYVPDEENMGERLFVAPVKARRIEGPRYIPIHSDGTWGAPTSNVFDTPEAAQFRARMDYKYAAEEATGESAKLLADLANEPVGIEADNRPYQMESVADEPQDQERGAQ